MFIYHNDKQKMIKNRHLSSENQFLELVAALQYVIFQKNCKNFLQF